MKLAAVLASMTLFAATPSEPPATIAVLPVLFVPKDGAAPDSELPRALMQHLQWARARYREMLGGRDTFQIARDEPLVVTSRHTLAQMRSMPEGGAPEIVAELLAHLGKTRFDCPYVLFAVVVNPHDDFPSGGGRPLNGGYDRGGGIVELSSFAVEKVPNVQSTIQHELGHAFGLLHSDAWGRSLSKDASIMSYDPSHHTRGFEPSKTPGSLVDVDLAGLAANRRAFPSLERDRKITLDRWLPPMTIPGHADYAVKIETTNPDQYASKASNAVLGRLSPSRGPGITFDASTMWHTSADDSGRVTLTLTFPIAVTLDRVGVHTQHSGEYHAATSAKVEIETKGRWKALGERALGGADDEITFREATATRWRVHLKQGESGHVVVRALRFHHGDVELFAPAVVDY